MNTCICGHVGQLVQAVVRQHVALMTAPHVLRVSTSTVTYKLISGGRVFNLFFLFFFAPYTGQKSY